MEPISKYFSGTKERVCICNFFSIISTYLDYFRLDVRFLPATDVRAAQGDESPLLGRGKYALREERVFVVLIWRNSAFCQWKMLHYAIIDSPGSRGFSFNQTYPDFKYDIALFFFLFFRIPSQSRLTSTNMHSIKAIHENCRGNLSEYGMKTFRCKLPISINPLPSPLIRFGWF